VPVTLAPPPCANAVAEPTSAIAIAPRHVKKIRLIVWILQK
jgi:hypothetical protein